MVCVMKIIVLRHTWRIFEHNTDIQTSEIEGFY